MATSEHDKQPLLTTEEAAEILNVSAKWVYEKSLQGFIPRVNMGEGKRSLVRFRPEDIWRIRNEGLQR